MKNSRPPAHEAQRAQASREELAERLARAIYEDGTAEPLVMREIIYRLMLGAQGSRLHQIAAMGGATHRIAQAVERLRNDFDQPLCIKELARELA